MVGGLITKSSGLVLDTFHQPGLAEPGAITLKDYSRWGNDGAFVGAGHPDWVQLPSGLWVMSLFGTDEVNLGNDVSLEPRVITLEVWINPSTITGSYRVVGKRAQFSYELDQINNTLLWWAGAHAGAYVYSTPILEVGKWFHIIADYTTSPLGFKEYYINGVPNNSATRAVTLDYSAHRNVYLANGTFAASGRFQGLMAPPRIHGRVLGAAEKVKRFTATRAWFGV